MTLLTTVGARPQFVKAAVVSRVLRRTIGLHRSQTIEAHAEDRTKPPYQPQMKTDMQTSISITTNSHQRNLHLQAEQHPLVDDQSFPSIEGYINHLIHLKAYDEAARFVAGKAVLDVGCNAGYGIEVLAATATLVAGIDVSPQAVKAAQTRLGAKADIRLYNGVQCSFAARSFDVATSFQVIEHVSDYKAYLSEIVRLLRPDGMVVFTTPNARLRLDPGMKPWNEFHVREFSPSELKELLSTSFDSVEIRGLFGEDELHQIECKRCARARVAARSRPASPRPTLGGTVKRALPWLVPVRNRVRKWTRREQEPARLARTDIARFSTQDLFYKTDSLDEALDLMAICRNARKQ
jgi:2-polyprenyl-3-methyl-5-hydroxy-6-metoxy-1,4-benzoquinol methylase